MADDDDEEKFRVRRASVVKRKTVGGGGHAKLDARQYAMFVGACFLISWGLVVTVLLLRLGIMYTFNTIALTRQNYGVGGAAAWAKVVASQDVMEAIEVWNIINSSVAGIIYRSPQDYTNLGNVLNPAFQTMSSLHSVDFGFSDRNYELTVTRQKDLGIGSLCYMQSNSGDCFLLGAHGCMPLERNWYTQEIIRPEWYRFASTLKVTPSGGIYYWALKPELVVETGPEGEDLISPSIRLIFKVSLPTYRSDSGDPVEVVGRITVKVAALSGSRLVDPRLGGDGNVYLCDATGAMLASKDSDDLLMVENGIVRYKYFWELGEGWASSIREAFTGSSVTQKMSDEEETLVVVEPLDPPLGRFGVIVVARSWGPFQNGPLIGTSAISSIVAPAPYAITGAVAFIFFWAQCFNTMRANDGKVGADTMKQQSRVSISATMQRHTISNIPQGVDLAELAKLEKKDTWRGKLGKAATFMRQKTIGG